MGTVRSRILFVPAREKAWYVSEALSMNRLTHKVAIVTGSSSGIGKAIALSFAREGAMVVIAARREALCRQLAQSICEEGGKALAVPTDIREESQVTNLFERTREWRGRVDILVNNAGIFGGGTIEQTAMNVFYDVWRTNVLGTFLCCREGFRQMKARGGGLILNMSSVAGTDAWAGTGSYSATKFAVLGLTKALADEGRPYGIKASAICPGGVADDLVDAAPEAILRSQKISPYDIAETAVYLAALSPNAIVHRIVVDRLGAEW